MTALTRYQRIEASALWRAGADTQRRDVILSLGKTSLIISDKQERPLAHWSLAAVERSNPGAFPAIYHPAGDPAETIELAEDERAMLEALETLRKVVAARRPRPGRLRLGVLASSMALIMAVGALWMPMALRNHVANLTPAVKRAEIGQAILDQMAPMTGAPCANPVAFGALFNMVQRLQTPDSNGAWRVTILRAASLRTAHLPGRILLLGQETLELADEPNLIAGHLLAESVRLDQTDPLIDYLKGAGFMETLRLLTTGQASAGALRVYARDLLSKSPPAMDQAALHSRFTAAGLPIGPYIATLRGGSTGSDTINSNPILDDSDWLRLQNICTK